MAHQTSVTLVDDLDGGKAAETVVFGLDGASYEIDLSKKNAGPASPRPHHTDMSGSGSGDDDADLAALEADLQVLFRP